MKIDKENALILWFDQTGIEDVPLVGGKNASLGEMYRELGEKGVKVPNGFSITAKAYDLFLEKTGIKQKIAEYCTTRSFCKISHTFWCCLWI